MSGMSILSQINAEFEGMADPKRAELSQWFFKTGPGQYGAGDHFLGLTVPQQRQISRHYFKELPLKDLIKLLNSKFHEQRLTALLMLVLKYQKSKSHEEQEKIVDFYLKHRARINNWDLVDSSARYILGAWLQDKERTVLYDLAKSPSLWDRRIAIISCHAFILNGDFEDAFGIAEILMKDKEDLLHKAVGWMLREIWKKDEDAALSFLRKHRMNLARTTLRYAIERASPKQKLELMKKH